MPEETSEYKGPETPSEEEYELLPHKEVVELKEQLEKLKTFEVAPTKKLTVNLVELNTKLEKLLAIFDEASKQITVEEGGLTFQDRMKPMLEKMNKILEQNSEIAEGIVAVADMVKEFRGDLESKGILVRETPLEAPGEPAVTPPAGMMPLPGMPPLGIPPLPGTPPPPKKKFFGI